jgi:hypothetical protein
MFIFIPKSHSHKNTTVYKYMTLLLQVSAYSGHFQAGGYQRKEKIGK